MTRYLQATPTYFLEPQMNNRMLEMKITVNAPECCRACDNHESGPCPKFEDACRELYSEAVSSYVEERAEAAADGFACEKRS